jgi:hypothetical protein
LSYDSKEKYLPKEDHPQIKPAEDDPSQVVAPQPAAH